jgi:hypothetical protein
MMVAVAAVGLAFAYAARYYECNSIADKHLQQLVLLYQKYSFGVHNVKSLEEMETYYERNYIENKRAAIYPWVRVEHRFVPFDEVGRSETAP